MNAKQILQKELALQGFAIRIDKWPTRLTYYKPDGEPMPKLPADPFSMQQYLKRGFTLMPPKVQEDAPLYISDKDKAKIKEKGGETDELSSND